MEPHEQNQRVFALPNGHPTSPPMTPGSRSYARFPPQTSHTSPIYKRMGLSMLAQSPPLEFIEPTGQGHQFHFTRPQSRAHSSRPSSASGHACNTSLQNSDDEDESDEESEHEEVRPARRVEKADFVLEELDSDPDYDSDTPVLHPSHVEYASSERSGARLEEIGFIDKFNELRCREGSSDDEEEEEEQRRIYRRKKKRWSAGIFKRSHSQSVEGDSTDDEVPDDGDSTTRRLRRRVRGPGDRSSLIFEDLGFSSANYIPEVDEPDDVEHSKGPPSIPSDDGFMLDENGRWRILPFWEVEAMEVQDDSS